MNILFTAFKGAHNTSFQLVNQISAEHTFLTNSFQGLKRDISSIDSDYDVVYMFGVDKRLTNEIRIELCAKDYDEMVVSGFKLSHIEERLRTGEVSYTVSNRTTSYLCNAAYYQMLKKNSNTIFIHIPSLKGMTAELMQKLIEAFRDICEIYS